MKKLKPSLAAAVVLSLASSCIVSDQCTTLTIQSDGGADWVRYQSNIRSSEPGEKGAAEMKSFADEFEGRRDSECARFLKAGGEIRESRWVRRQEPCATLVAGTLPDAKALEEFCTIRDEKGEPEQRARFVKEGQRRRLSATLRISKDDLPAAGASAERRRQDRANGLSETRVAVAEGRIVAARGFAVAEDKRSALLDVTELEELLRAGGGQAEVFLEWDLASR